LNSDLYALIALAARYWFVALIAVLLFRGWRMTVADNRRAKLLREWMGQTGCVGELIANPGAKRHTSYPIPREGVLGSARNADVRIRHRDLRRAHAHFELREGGLLLKPLGRAELKVGGGFTGDAVFLQDGDVLTIGRLQLMLVLFDAPVEEEEDEWFEVGPDAAVPADEEAEEWYSEYGESAAAHARRMPDGGDERPQTRPKRVRKVPVSLDGQFSEKPASKRGRKAASSVNLPFDLQPAPRHAHPTPDDVQTWSFPRRDDQAGGVNLLRAVDARHIAHRRDLSSLDQHVDCID
jgi:predicted component of type VI protein secretion system